MYRHRNVRSGLRILYRDIVYSTCPRNNKYLLGLLDTAYTFEEAIQQGMYVPVIKVDWDTIRGAHKWN